MVSNHCHYRPGPHPILVETMGIEPITKSLQGIFAPLVHVPPFKNLMLAGFGTTLYRLHGQHKYKYLGTGRGTRTLTPQRTPGPKPCASTNSAIPARNGRRYIFMWNLHLNHNCREIMQPFPSIWPG